ncbi:MAG: DUF3151 domain-containing protein [Acidimicrobiia bacterium]
MADPPLQDIGRGLPETVLPAEPDDTARALVEAMATDMADRRAAVASVAARWPRSLSAWASLGEMAGDDVEAYAYFRVGYHRGLDALRQAGWRGSGYVRWDHPPNHGFLRALDGLRRAAGRIGETDEEARCTEFLRQLDPRWRP